MSENPTLELLIHPEPDADEEAVILATLLLRQSRMSDVGKEHAETTSRWAMAGRLHAHRIRSMSLNGEPALPAWMVQQ